MAAKDKSKRPQGRSPASKQGNDRRRVFLLAGAGVAVVAVLVAVVLAGVDTGVSSDPPSGVVEYPVESVEHVTGTVAYDPIPPVGGSHASEPIACGVYDQPIPNENAVHTLEHGAVWLTYQPELSSEDIEKVEDLASAKVIVSPYPGIDAPVIASSWGHQLKADSADDPRLAQFIRAFRSSPEAPEPNVPC